jgi:hypothetical protein
VFCLGSIVGAMRAKSGHDGSTFWLFRVVRSRPRLFGSAAASMLVAAALPALTEWRPVTRLLVGWDIGSNPRVLGRTGRRLRQKDAINPVGKGERADGRDGLLGGRPSRSGNRSISGIPGRMPHPVRM